MYLEAVTVCVDYTDYLAEVLSYNRALFDRWLIVTSSKDEQTQDFCWKHNLECLVTEDFYKENNEFDKAKAIDHGMAQLSWKDWVVHIDSDIVLPNHTKTSLNTLETDKLYGCDRIMVDSFERWQRLKSSKFIEDYSRSHHFNVCFPSGFDIGARWADIHHSYCPIGFFQLMHRNSVMRNGIRTKRYSSFGHNDAARTDVQFALQWDRANRILLPELVAIHLSNSKDIGANWKGRRTGLFRSHQQMHLNQETENEKEIY